MQAPFYPTVTDKVSTNGLAFTAELQSIPVTDPEFTSSYYLGWMRWETLPLQYHVSRASFEDGVLTFTDITKVENVPVGFSVHNKNYYDAYQYGVSEEKYNGTKWANIDWTYSSAAPTNFFLPNNLDINVLSWGRLRLIFLAMSEDRSIVLESVIADVPYSDFAAGNDMTAVILDGGSLRNQTFTVTKDDISNYAIFQKEINNTVFDIVLAAYTVPYNRDCRFDNNVDDYAAVHPMIKVHTTEGATYVSGITNPMQYQFSDDCRWGSGYLGQGFFSNWSGMVDRLSSSRITDEIWDRFGGFVGSFKVSDLAPFAIDLFVPEGATFYVRGIGRNDINILGRVLTYDEILHCLSLLPRMQDTTTNLYAQNASYWYGHVDYETNEFLGDLVNGSQLNKLVDWQLLGHNINENDFKEEDVPEYVPPDDDTELAPRWRGDTGPLNLNNIGVTGNFITNWVCTSANVTQFGKTLWTDLLSFDPNDPATALAGIWENIKIAGGSFWSTGSLDPANILDFVVGLRYYPFNIRPMCSLSTYSKIYFGAGRYGVDAQPATDPVYKLNYMCYYLGRSTLDTATNTDLKIAGDWTDYDDTVASLYLPFCGTFNVDWKEICGTTIYVDWVIDFATGIITAYARSMAPGTINGNLIAVGSGVCGVEVPISATNANRISAALFGDTLQAVSNIVSPVKDAMQGVASVLTYGATAGAGGDGGEGDGSTPSAPIGDALSANPMIGPLGGIGAKQAAGLAQQAAGIMARPGVGCPLIAGSKGWGSLMGQIGYAYLQVRRPRYVKPTNYKNACGQPLWATKSVGSLTGWTECTNVNTTGLTCTDRERAMIKSLLETGVYL